MNSNLELVRKDSGILLAKHFRRLKGNERVLVGDFVGDENRVSGLWEGPAGFQADSFLRPIYREIKSAGARRKR